LLISVGNGICGNILGLSYASSIQSILGEVSSQERAGYQVSTLFSIVEASILELIVGRASHYFDLIQNFGIYLGLVFLMFVALILFI